MNLDERLKKMEIELARAKRSMAVVLLAVVLLTFALLAFVLLKTAKTAGVASREEVINAKQFNLLDDNGKTRAALGIVGDGPVLKLIDADGKPLATLAVLKDGPKLALWDANGKASATLAVLKDEPGLNLTDANGKVIWEAPQKKAGEK